MQRRTLQLMPLTLQSERGYEDIGTLKRQILGQPENVRSDFPPLSDVVKQWKLKTPNVMACVTCHVIWSQLCPGLYAIRNSRPDTSYEQLESSSRSPARCSRLTLLSVLKLVLRAGYCICSERERAARRIRNTYFSSHKCPT